MRCSLCLSKDTHYFATKNNYIFYRCPVCKTLLLKTLPSQKNLDTYYAKQFIYRDGLRNELPIRKRSRIILKKIAFLAPTAETICDVGSGYGFFLDEAKRGGFDVFGVEPSGQLTHHSYITYSIKSFQGTLDEYARVNPRQFDIVTCIHVIEHIPNSKKFIQTLFKLVKPGGILYIETPNSDSHLLYAEKENYTFLIPPEHLWILSQDSFRYLLPRNSQIIGINTYSYSEHLMGIVKQIINMCKSALRAKPDYSETTSKRLPHPPTLRRSPRNDNTFQKRLSYLLFDRTLAPLFTSLLNLYHKGSILELYIRKN